MKNINKKNNININKITFLILWIVLMIIDILIITIIIYWFLKNIIDYSGLFCFFLFLMMTIYSFLIWRNYNMMGKNVRFKMMTKKRNWSPDGIGGRRYRQSNRGQPLKKK